MKLNGMTRRWLKSFAEEKIYQRGEDYFQSGMVYQVEYHPKNLQIRAEVSGNYGNYEVKISEDRADIDAYCDCPYDRYPCKHIIAVLLNFIENKKKHIHQAKERKNFFDSLKDTLSQYSHEQLIKIIVEAAQNHRDFKRELMILLEPDNAATLEVFLSQIRYIRLDDFEDGYGSGLEKIRELKKMLKSVEKANAEIKSTINWEIADKILDFLNQYGVSDERWEDLVIQAFETLSDVLVETPELDEKRQAIVEKLKRYYDWGNCGMVDDISELIEELSN